MAVVNDENVVALASDFASKGVSAIDIQFAINTSKTRERSGELLARAF